MSDNTPQSANEALLADILGGSYETGIPQSRMEKIWAYALKEEGVSPEAPQSRLEALAIQVAEAVRTGGGGGGGGDLAKLVDGSYAGPFNDNTITTIRSSAFRGETNITGISAASVTSIGTHIAYGATSLTTVSLPSLSSVNENAFYNCTALTTVDISGATEVKQDAFNNCTALTSVNASSLRVIGSQAFWNCRNLSHIELPKATSINAGVFGSCPSLEWVSFDEITSVPTLGNTNAFYTTTLFYFPDDLIDIAKAAQRWSTIADRIKPLSEKPSA